MNKLSLVAGLLRNEKSRARPRLHGGRRIIQGWGVFWAIAVVSFVPFVPNIQAQPLPPLEAGIAQISAGLAHTCAVTTAGKAYCWGYNSEGQLGDGSIVDKGPVAVALPIGSEAAAVAAGNGHTCALTRVGEVYCWGYNSAGQLGSPGGRNPVPTLVEDLPVATAIAVGTNRSCAIAGGNLYCWGQNWHGELGNNSTWDSGSPVLVTGPGGSGSLSDVTAVALSQGHSCAIAGGSVYCWGSNDEGQLGIGSNTAPFTTPQAIVSLSTGAMALAAGNHHTCALITGGSIQCWGSNGWGQLGNGEQGSPPSRNDADRNSPVAVSGMLGATAVTAGTNYSCALVNGSMRCWGSNWAGQLGNGQHGDEDASSVPVAVSGLAGITAMAAGDAHVCTLDGAGMARCWGLGDDGQLGDGFTESTPEELRDTPPWLPQTISFPGPGTQAVGTPLVLAGAASSGLPLVYSVSGACSASGRTLRFSSPGTCTVIASHAGSARGSRPDWLPAASVERSFTVNATAATNTVTPVPTLGTWSVALLGLLLALAVLHRRRLR